MPQPQETGREDLPYVDRISIRQAISDPIFSGLGESIMNTDQAHAYIKERFPNFNFEGVNAEGIKFTQTLIAKLQTASREAVILAEENNTTESLRLARKVKLIKDPTVSIEESGIMQWLEATRGDLNMTVAFLGLRDVENGNEWVKFIIRTWGKNPLRFS